MIQIQHYDQLDWSPAYKIAVRGHAELTANGLGPPATVLSWDQKAIVAEIDGQQAGVILWTHIKHQKCLFIALGWVDPAWRRHGVYAAMWQALVEKARTVDGVISVDGATHVDNAEMRAVAKRLGRTEQSVNLTFKL